MTAPRCRPSAAWRPQPDSSDVARPHVCHYALDDISPAQIVLRTPLHIDGDGWHPLPASTFGNTSTPSKELQDNSFSRLRLGLSDLLGEHAANTQLHVPWDSRWLWHVNGGATPPPWDSRWPPCPARAHLHHVVAGAWFWAMPSEQPVWNTRRKLFRKEDLSSRQYPATHVMGHTPLPRSVLCRHCLHDALRGSGVRPVGRRVRPHCKHCVRHNTTTS